MIPEEILNMRDANHNRFTDFSRRVFVCWYENWSVVAVILEKKIAIVVKVR